jgi:P2 family phage major capsid protein
MQNQTRLKFDKYTAQLAKLNGISSVAVKFNVEPSVEQKLEQQIQESDAFLAAINIQGVIAQMGDKIGIGVSGTIAGRTNTKAGNKRIPRDVSSLDKDGYICRKTNFDTAHPYDRLDAWAHKPDFNTLLQNAIVRQQGLDRIMIGWNGIRADEETDRAANPLLQDCNIGWLQKIRDNAPEQYIERINIGAGPNDPAHPTYKNLDQAVLDCLDLLHPTLRNASDLVVVASEELINDKYVSLAGDHDEPTEREAFNRLLSNKRVAGKPVVTPPFFPRNAFLVTTISNLSVYWQISSRRRHIKDVPDSDRIEDYQSVNEDYVVEQYAGCAFVEGIHMPNDAGDAWEPIS